MYQEPTDEDYFCKEEEQCDSEKVKTMDGLVQRTNGAFCWNYHIIIFWSITYDIHGRFGFGEFFVKLSVFHICCLLWSLRLLTKRVCGEIGKIDLIESIVLRCTISNTTQTVHAWGFEMNDFTVMTSIMVENDVIITIIGVIYKQRQHAFPYRTSTRLRWRHSKFNFSDNFGCADLWGWEIFAAHFTNRRRKKTTERPSVRVINPCRKAWSIEFARIWVAMTAVSHLSLRLLLEYNLFSSGHFSCAITFRRSVVKILLWSGRNLFTQQLCVHYCTYHVLSSQICFQTVWFLCLQSVFSFFWRRVSIA